MDQAPLDVEYDRVRVHTAPPRPPFGHSAQLAPHPPPATPAQFNRGRSMLEHPAEGIPICWTMSAGVLLSSNGAPAVFWAGAIASAAAMVAFMFGPIGRPVRGTMDT